MIYPANFEQKTGFDEIRRMLADSCACQLGRRLTGSMAFSNDFGLVKNRLEQTGEMMDILQNGSSFPSQDYFDLTPEIERLRPEGTFIEPERLPELRASLHAIRRIRVFLAERDDDKYPALRQLATPVSIPAEIPARLNTLLDDRGEISDNASGELYKIRGSIKQKQALAARRIEELLTASRKNGLVADDTEITLRNGRLVIPVAAANKRRLKGFIHDVSATGQTVFIEPEEVFEINNDVAGLMGLERREIIRLLTEFTNLIRPRFPELEQAYQFLGEIDFVRAKARFAITTHADIPLLNNRPVIHWRRAAHPLLFMLLRSQKKEIVPLDLSLSPEKRILIISGPNAGGKSVCLRTAGLLQYMLQCGLPIPVNPASEAGMFDDIFIDIGDEQSIENDLSTYSSHLLNMKRFMQHARPSSLFLIDELGSGTEPRAGGAIAEAVIENMSNTKAFGIITTHYANLKLLDGKVDGVVNGAMLFDIRQMKPLYKLITGKPGSSFAFEIARQMGLPEDVIGRATQKTGETQLSFDRQLQQLETEKEDLARKHAGLMLADEILTQTLKKYQDLYNQLESTKKEILKQARTEAAALLKETGKRIENTILDIRKAQAEKAKTRELRQALQKEAQAMQKEAEAVQSNEIVLVKPESINPEPAANPEQPLKAGDVVRIKKLNAIGELAALNGDDAQVIFDNVKLSIRANQLEKAPAGELKKQVRRSGRMTDEINEKLSAFRLTIDVRGARGDEALARVDHYIDEAILLSIKEVRILHGKGNGILRTLVRGHLARQKAVAAYDDESQEAGGSGVTVVRLK